MKRIPTAILPVSVPNAAIIVSTAPEFQRKLLMHTHTCYLGYDMKDHCRNDIGVGYRRCRYYGYERHCSTHYQRSKVGKEKRCHLSGKVLENG